MQIDVFTKVKVGREGVGAQVETNEDSPSSDRKHVSE